MQSTIYYLQQQLREAKETISRLESGEGGECKEEVEDTKEVKQEAPAEEEEVEDGGERTEEEAVSVISLLQFMVDHRLEIYAFKYVTGMGAARLSAFTGRCTFDVLRQIGAVELGALHGYTSTQIRDVLHKAGLSRCYSDVIAMLQRCYSDVTAML